MKKIAFVFIGLLGTPCFAASPSDYLEYLKLLGTDIRGSYVCDSLQVRNRKLKYCYLSPSKFEESQPVWSQLSFNKSRPVRPLFYFHGAGGSNLSQYFDGFYIKTQKQLKKDGFAPLPIFVSFGPTWLFSHDSDYYSVDDFMTSVLPTLLARIQSKEPAFRFETKISVMGGSMGGHNALQIYLNHPDKTVAVAVFCSAVIELGPQTTNQELEAYLQRTHAEEEYAKRIPGIVRGSYASTSHYNRDHLLNKIRSNQVLPPLWAQYDDGDEFGFDDTNEDFFKLLAEKNASAPVAVTHAHGRHCGGAGAHMDEIYTFLNR